MTKLRYTCRAFDELSASELHDILTLRAVVFVVEQECAYQDPDVLDRLSHHLCGWLDGRLVAYARWFEEPGRIRLGRIVTAPDFRGRGLGRALMEEIIRRLSGHELFLHGQSHLCPFYESLGFFVEGEPFWEDGIPHRALRRPAYSSASR